MTDEVVLTDGKIFARPCRPCDAEAIYEAVRESITVLYPWAPWCPADYSMSYCSAWLESRADAWGQGVEFDFAVFDENDKSFLGVCGLYDINRIHNFANLGYWVRTSRTGQGQTKSAQARCSMTI